MGRLVLNGKSYTGDESNGHLYGEDPPRAEQGVEGSMYIQYTATKEEDEEGHIIKVPDAIVAVYSKIDGQWMIFNDTEVPETHYYSWVIPNPQGGAIASLTKVNIDGSIYSIDAAGSEVIPNKQGTPSHDLDQVEIDGVLYLIRGLGTPVEANPQDTASTNLSKIKIDGTAYNVVGTEVEANPSGTATTDLTKLNVDGTIYSIPEGGTEVEANPAGAATATLGKLGVDDTIYSIPVGSTVVANPSSGTAVGTLTRLDVDGDIYNIDTGSGGSEVEGNPSGAATVILHKLGIDGTIYSVDGSGSEVEPNPAGEATDVLNKLGVDGTIYSVGGGASTLSGLSDVDVESPTDGQVLSYDSTNNEWVNSDPTGNVDDVQVNGTSVLDSNKIAQITSYREVTQAEYDALPASKESDGVLYCIKDKATTDTTVAPIIYSEDEREVGVWTDGKPLYQKTFITTTPSTVDLQTIVADATNLAIDTVVNINGFLYCTSLNQFIPIEFPFSTNVLLSTYLENQKIMQMVPSSNYTNCAESITIQYTKTTDTPGSGKYAPSGVPAVHYSENEQVVGTWVDGSTLYERTYTDIGFIGTSDTTIVDANIKSNSGIYNVKSITGLWSIGGFGYSDATIQAFGETGIFTGGSQTLYARVTPNGLAVVRTNTNLGYSALLTVRYTKSTS